MGYHKTVRQTDEIVSFWHEMNRPVVMTIERNDQIRHDSTVLAEIPKNSAMYKILDTVALKHMYLAAVYQIESSKGQISWMENASNPTTRAWYSGGETVAELDRWFRSFLPLLSEPI